MRALRNKSTLQRFTDGWLAYYNFLRPHDSLDDKTPAEKAGIKFKYSNWADVVNNEYPTDNVSSTDSKAIEPQKTKVIINHKKKLTPEQISEIKTYLANKVKIITERPKAIKPRITNITPKMPRITPKVPRITKSVFSNKSGSMLSRHGFKGSHRVKNLGAGVIRHGRRRHLRLH